MTDCQKVFLNNNQTESYWISIYRGASLGTNLGPLVFNLYINSFLNAVQDAFSIQYAEDTLIYLADENYLDSNSKLSQNFERLFHFPEMHHLTLNANKTEFMLTAKKKSMNGQTPVKIIIEGEKITSSNSVKSRGVTLDRNLTYQEEVLSILRKMAGSIKAINTIRCIYGEQSKLLPLKSIILSHLQCLSVLLTGITSNRFDTLDQQVNWALTTCFYRKKYDSSNDLRGRYLI